MHIAVAIANNEATFESNWSNFTSLHQRRRQSLGQSGCFSNATFTRFLYDVAKHFHQAGLLDLVCISVDNRPIAAEICFRDRASSFAYQIGIDPDALEHNPGWLVNTASIRNAIELGLSSFDLCRGDAEYKRQLGATPTVCKKLRIVPPRLTLAGAQRRHDNRSGDETLVSWHVAGSCRPIVNDSNPILTPSVPAMMPLGNLADNATLAPDGYCVGVPTATGAATSCPSVAQLETPLVRRLGCGFGGRCNPG